VYRKKGICLLAVLIVAVLAVNSHALVEWDIREILKTDEPPVDVVVSRNGKWIYILTAPGDVLIYTPDGKLRDKIGVGKHIDQITIGPSEDLLLLTSRKQQTVQIMILDFIREISTSGSPFKGSAEAPVVIAVFSDFQ
jgi:hypothetical protein